MTLLPRRTPLRSGPGRRGPVLALALVAVLGVGCRTSQVSRLPAAGATQMGADAGAVAPDPPADAAMGEATRAVEASGAPATRAPAPTVPPTVVPPAGLSLTLEPVAEGFDSPVGLAAAGDGSGRLFVVEKAGRIRVVAGGKVWPTPLLDLRDLVGDSASEQGLLGLAFHPDVGEDPAERRFYVNYTDTDGDTVVAEYQLRPDGAAADETTGRILLQVEQPAGNHNGGHLAFGPDGYLYIGLGDGGGAGDRYGNARNPATLLGKMLRLDVAGEPYAIPEDNPFVGRAEWREEVWAFGLRNPWRYSFDSATGELYLGDVGQGTWEEINLQPAAAGGGQDYGWPLLEGNHCYEGGTDCDLDGRTVRPILEYEHGAEGCSVTGGYVYRGQVAPFAVGAYVFGDYCSGRIWAARPAPDGSWARAELQDTELSVSSFGQGDDGELYVLDYAAGRVYRLAFGRQPSAGGAEGDAGPKASGGSGGYPR